MIVLGIEGTAHTLGIGIYDSKRGILANEKDVYMPKHGSGIHPTEAADHHRKAAGGVLSRALEAAGIDFKKIDMVSYSAGPGLPPCLKATMEFAKDIVNSGSHRNGIKPKKLLLIPVNHCIAHIEIGRFCTKADDPITLYVSGGNTQVIGYAAGRYRVFGETLDISIGNALDVFARETTGKYPGGPVVEKLAKAGNYIELPYVVKGMDLSFSGILTAALQKYKGSKSGKYPTTAGRRSHVLKDLCFSIEENCYAMLTEVTERALAHTGKREVLLTGGVAASKRLQEMLGIMCKERSADFYVVPQQYAGDCGAMIAYTGWLGYAHGQPLQKAGFHQNWRTDEVDVLWR
ncbi:MAG: tRNA (adenosine(37)-N6)-threonylcarbamoyltransferase complex transferase subunit TsaD [Candidatus Aenigmarchaeota archaeon]|nr:tRNA (adenosine(37)-N6)-threonylcarbamoyltransferase complex transferase subunit TsaD [Candidatus Aenigmarchaeota archaeon]